MPRIAAIVFLGSVALGQTVPMRIPPEVAAKHFIQAPQPQYPQLAEMARIQGNVILEIGIDEAGGVTVRRLISGHPMLAPAAIEAVKRWRYEPPLADGKPTSAVTVVLVAFGNAAYYAAAGQAELAFQNDFWAAEESAQASLTKGDYVHAEEQLNQAQGLVSPDKDAHHIQERWQCMTTFGRLRMEQKKYEDAERYFKNALALRQNKWEDKDSPEIAVSLANLAAVLAEEKRFDLARENAAHALAIYRKNFKKTSSAAPRQVYGRAIANESRMLLKLAQETNDTKERDEQCRIILEFQVFLTVAERDSVASACQSARHGTATNR
jgi:TonB family protein